MYTKITSTLVLFLFIAFALLLFPVSSTLAQTEGIPLQKDVFLGAPIYAPEDLPEEITFSLYDAPDAIVPLGSQTFARGQYTVDFEFSQSNGVTAGSVARVKAEFTQTLNLTDAYGETLKPKEIWAALEVTGGEVGARTKVSDETLVRLLLASNASLATYLTLAYEGDENPITTIYKDLPLSYSTAGGTTTSLSSYFSSLPVSREFGSNVNWVDIGTGSYILGKVGIGTTNPLGNLHIAGGVFIMNNNNDGSGISFKSLSAVGNKSAFYWTNSAGIEQWRFVHDVNGNGTNDLEYRSKDVGSVLYLKKNGNVGIGTTNPLGKLHIGSGVFIMNNNNDGSGISFKSLSAVGNKSAFYWTNSVGTEQWRFVHDANGNGTNDLQYTSAGVGAVLCLKKNGNVGIGTTNPTYKLSVLGTVRSTEMIVDTGWSDFVFNDNYKLPQLNEVEQFIKEHKHLPGIPTEAEVKEKGVSVGNISSKLLQKIEELTLYVIDIKKENDSLKEQVANMEAQLKEIKN